MNIESINPNIMMHAIRGLSPPPGSYTGKSKNTCFSSSPLHPSPPGGTIPQAGVTSYTRRMCMPLWKLGGNHGKNSLSQPGCFPFMIEPTVAVALCLYDLRIPCDFSSSRPFASLRSPVMLQIGLQLSELSS